jgi:hypothetical protein
MNESLSTLRPDMAVKKNPGDYKKSPGFKRAENEQLTYMCS